MVQNRNKLIDFFVGNLSNAIVHTVLEKAAGDNAILAKSYQKESINSKNTAVHYRNMINPIYTSLPDRDIDFIKKCLTQKVTSELKSRILKKYENVDLTLIEPSVDKVL